MLSKNLKKLRQGFTLVEIMIVVLIIGILLAIAVPNFVRAREQSRAKSCSANLKQIESAVQQYAMENRLNDADPVADADLFPKYIKVKPTCPSSGVYSYATVGATPACDKTSADYKHTVSSL